MKPGLIVVTTGALLWSIVASYAVAQKGMGEPTGVARQAAKPEIVALRGKVLKVKSEPCETTTGAALLGTHFLLKTSKGEKLNIHLGPASVVRQKAEELTVGEKVTVKAFRTAKMPENHFVALSVAFHGTKIELRDENLRPFWAGGGAVLPGRGEADSTWRRGPGRTWRPRWQRGRGYGRGWGRGWRWQRG
jgi:hypothetical protein